MQRKQRIWGRLVRAEVGQLLRLRGTRVGGPGGESAPRFRGAALVLLALLALPVGSATAAPTPDPHPTAKAPASTGAPAPDPYASGSAATTAPAPTPAPAPSTSSGSSTSAPSSPTVTREPSATTTQASTPAAEPSAGTKKPARTNGPRRQVKPVEPVVAGPTPVPDVLGRAVAAAIAAPAATSDGSRLLLGGLGLLTLVLASGSFLVFLATRGAGWETRT